MIALRRSIDAIVAIGVETIHEHDVKLANQFRAGLGLGATNSAIVSLPWEGAAAHLAAAGVKATEWRGNLRMSFHLYNSGDDVARAVEVLTAIRK
jgi:selenocysteine lyase/cysteine desulfurase